MRRVFNVFAALMPFYILGCSVTWFHVGLSIDYYNSMRVFVSPSDNPVFLALLWGLPENLLTLCVVGLYSGRSLILEKEIDWRRDLRTWFIAKCLFAAGGLVVAKVLLSLNCIVLSPFQRRIVPIERQQKYGETYFSSIGGQIGALVAILYCVRRKVRLES